MKYNLSDEFLSSEEFNRQYYRRQIVKSISDVAHDLMYSLKGGGHRFELLEQHRKLSNALDNLWLQSIDGTIRVDSIAILRAIRKVICADIGTSLRQNFISRKKLQTEISLLITTIDQLLLPTQRGC